jgi:predicted DsbA family dithiol-disulfide isomerase
MYDQLLGHQGELRWSDLMRHAEELELDVERFTSELRDGDFSDRVLADVASADESGVTGTPTFFINGRRHYGLYDLQTLTEAVNAAKRRAVALAAA